MRRHGETVTDEYGAIVDENAEFRRAYEKKIRDTWGDGFRWGVALTIIGTCLGLWLGMR